MIERDEIEEKSEEFDINIHDVERDYVFGWLLKCFFEDEYLASNLILKGGNAFRKAFYPATRFSRDLDFSVLNELDVDAVQASINSACDRASAQCGVEFFTDKNRILPGRTIDKTRKSYKGQVYFRDFYGEESHITISARLDITEFERLYLDVEPRPLLHPYSDADLCTAELRCVALEELMANKLKCLIQRRHTHDLYDFVYGVFVNPPAGLRRDQIVSVFLRKTIYERSPGAAKEILLGIPFAFFKGIWNKYIVCPITSRIDFETAESGFRSLIDELFGDAVLRRRLSPFVAPDQRNIILAAGAGRKLVRLGYDDIVRDVEPYALSYKRRKSDGEAFEYFYGYDRTGGNSGPSIKAFMPYKLQSVEATDVEFEPQFEIELSKAGETPEKGYFAGGNSFGGGRRSRARSRRTSVDPWKRTYKVACSQCGRVFTRSKPGTRIQKHKSDNGWDCSGRSGYGVF